MDIVKYAALERVVVTAHDGYWCIAGHFEDGGGYVPLCELKRIGKREDTAIRGIDKFKLKTRNTGTPRDERA